MSPLLEPTSVRKKVWEIQKYESGGTEETWQKYKYTPKYEWKPNISHNNESGRH